ncbi:UNVERIFIED_CONTAM: hypothetical protein GTU68_061737 [Idotea baltica]|nr:hypothetical protein [Idotea baltica]
MGTFFQTKEDANKSRDWHVVDANGITLGRLASEVAILIRGKHKPTYTPHNDGGDFVVILNADKIHLTGNKLNDKVYYHHTGYVGGIKDINAKDLLKKHPTRVVKKAIWGMLPKGKLGRQIFKKLKVYTGTEHPHTAQQAKNYTFKFTGAK